MRFMIFLVVLLSPLGVLAQDQTKPDYFACTQDTDCVIVEDTCPGKWTAVNTDYEEKYESYVARLRPVVECMNRPAEPMPKKGVCLYQHCRTPEEAGMDDSDIPDSPGDSSAPATDSTPDSERDN